MKENNIQELIDNGTLKSVYEMDIWKGIPKWKFRLWDIKYWFIVKWFDLMQIIKNGLKGVRKC